MSSRGKFYSMVVAGVMIVVLVMVTACNGSSSSPPSSSSSTPGIEANQPTIGPDTTGVTSTEIKWGTTFPLSGNPAAAYAPIAYGMDAFYKYINAQGGVYGRKLNLIIGDDQYNPANTVEVTRQLVEGDKVFGLIGNLGDATQLAVYKYLEERGVPNMFLSTGLAVWTNPIVKSRFGGNPDYITEGVFLAQYIKENYPGKKVGFLLQNDQLGDDGETGLKRGLEGSDVKIIDEERYEAIQADVSAQTQRLKNAGAEVLVAFAIPPQAASMVKSARETLNWDVPILVSGINCSEIFIALATPQDSEGVISFTFGHQAYETQLPGVQKYEKIWAKYGNGGSLTNFALYGMFVAELNVYITELAGPDINRQTYLDAAESTCQFMCTTCPGFGPVSLSPTDHQPTEVLVYNKVVNGGWTAVSDPVSFERTKSCTQPTLPADFDKQPKVGADAEFVDVP